LPGGLQKVKPAAAITTGEFHPMIKDLKNIVVKALREDNAWKDVTSQFTIPKEMKAKGIFIAKADGVICGVAILSEVFKALDKKCVVVSKVRDGARVKKGQAFAEVTGPARAVLAGERTALNFIQHLSGIATLTSTFVRKTKGTVAKIYDTRKTIPGLRHLAKYAVVCGGGANHRLDLNEMVLIKDNHLELIPDLAATVAKIKKSRKGIKVEIECETFAQVNEALAAGADIIMLDNMSIPLMKRSIAAVAAHAKNKKMPKPDVEISGGVNLSTVGAFAKLGVERISVGAITHSVTALDISLEFVKP
jgi:nicotinate-nucleotide pyrophosphorylase (carboxylating)